MVTDADGAASLPAADEGEAEPAGSDAQRSRAASALRRLGHALVGHDVDADLLERIAATAEAQAVEAEQTARRSRPVAAIKRRLWEDAPADGATMTHFPECVVSGSANPMGIAIDVRREGQEAVAGVHLGAAFEGAPQRAHGGVVAAVFDDVMGYVLQLHRVPAFTGRLAVSYRAPVPVHADVTVRARLVAVDGRKHTIAAEMVTSEGLEVLADAEALFISIPPERLGLSPSELAQVAVPAQAAQR